MSSQAEVLSLLSYLRPHDSQFRKMRAGSLGDGGYVLPDDLDGISGVLSIGIGLEVSFDTFFADRGVPIYQYDHTVSGPPVAHANFHFNAIALSPNDGEKERSIATMIREHKLDRDNNGLLKFDVEGAEWPVFPFIGADLLKYFRIITCELHSLNALHDRNFINQIRHTLTVLTQNHTVVHIHANNCCGISLVDGVPVPAVLEVTLLRNDRSTFTLSHDPIPGPLDFPNMTDRPDLVLRSFG